MVRHFGDAEVRVVDDHNAELGGPVQVHGIHADAGADHGLEARGVGEHLTRVRFAEADGDVGVLQRVDQRLRRFARAAADEGDAGGL